MKRFTPLLAILTVLVAVMGFTTSSAFAREGQDGNNVVCGGVPTKALLMKYVRGGADPCGHRDIGAIWARLGITPAVASKMHRGIVCSREGFMSSGRNHSPVPSEDKAVIVDGATVFFRPLSVWGETCYEAWVGYTEDGHKVAVLIGCGNGEGHMVVIHHRPLPCVHKAQKHRTLCRKPSPTPAPVSPLAPAAPAPSISIVNSPTFIQGQQQGQQQQQAQQNCIAIGGTWIESEQRCEIKQEQVQCNQNQVLEGNHCRPKTCEEEGNCPKPKTCAEEGLVGTFPNCRERTCEEKHSCTCKEKGLIGTYPNCHEEEKPCECKPPPPSPPTIVSVTRINDIRVGETSPNFCVTWEMPGSDTGTLTVSPEYSNFGSLGGKIKMTVSGLNEVCATIYPPTEVPLSGWDTMTVTLRDNNTDLPATPDVQKFRIDPEPVNPS